MMRLRNTGLQESIGKTACLIPNIKQFYLYINRPEIVSISVAEPHDVDAALTPTSGKVFDAVLAAPSPDPSLLYTKPTFLKQAKVYIW
jgi:hypothetical protein